MSGGAVSLPAPERDLFLFAARRLWQTTQLLETRSGIRDIAAANEVRTNRDLIEGLMGMEIAADGNVQWKGVGV